MTTLIAPTIRTDWEQLLTPLLYSARDRAQLPKLKTSPSMYWSIAPSLRALAASGSLISPVELPFVVDETASNDICFMDICHIYLQACRLFSEAHANGYTEEATKKLKKVRGALEYISRHPWLVGRNRSILPKCLQEGHLQQVIAEVSSWIAVSIIRAKCVAMWPYTDNEHEENRRKLVGCLHVLSEEELAATKQTDFVNFLYYRVCSDAHRKLPKREFTKCLPCFAKKVPVSSPHCRAIANEEAIMADFAVGHTQEEDHFSMRDFVPASPRFQELVVSSVKPFEEEDFFELVVHPIQIKIYF